MYIDNTVHYLAWYLWANSEIFCYSLNSELHRGCNCTNTTATYVTASLQTHAMTIKLHYNHYSPSLDCCQQFIGLLFL